MPGDVGLVAALLTKIFGFVVDEDGLKKMSREKKLKWIQRGIDDALAAGDLDTMDALFAEYRLLRQQTGP